MEGLHLLLMGFMGSVLELEFKDYCKAFTGLPLWAFAPPPPPKNAFSELVLGD